MTWLRGRRLPLAVLVAATGLLVTSIVWAAGAWWPAAGQPMMGSAISGDGPVRDLSGAAGAATRFADRWGLLVGEVMQFDNGFYAELVDPAGEGATEVLVDPSSGDVAVEWGPAMTWNTAYGMHPARADVGRVIGPEQARRIADAWLDENRSGEQADGAEAFPGYYTLHTVRGDRVVGMLSVHAVSGAVWHHGWHGRFVAMAGHNGTG